LDQGIRNFSDCDLLNRIGLVMHLAAPHLTMTLDKQEIPF
jgi:hypothetical protein